MGSKIKSIKKISKALLCFIFTVAALTLFSGSISAKAAPHLLQPYQQINYDQYDNNPGQKFTMMGINYTQGLGRYGWRDAWATFNLQEKVSAVSFKVGHIDGTNTRSGVMRIYLDNEFCEDYLVDLTSDMLTQTIQINTVGKKELSILITSGNDTATYGIADITAIGDNFHEYVGMYTLPATVKQAGIITYTCKSCNYSYEEEVPARKNCEDSVTTESDADRLILYQCNDCYYVNEAFGSNNWISMMGQRYYKGICKNSWRDASAVFNLNGLYSKVSFEIGHIDGGNTCPATLNIYNSSTLVKTMTLDWQMITQSIDINTTGAMQLKFEILSGNDTATYAICNIKGTRAVEKTLNHSYMDSVIAEAAFGRDGIVLHRCKFCGAEYQEKIPALKRNLTDDAVAVILSQDSFSYDGKAKKPTVTVTYGSDNLTNNTDYTLTYAKNVNVGTASVTIKGKGYYTGSKKVTFKIVKGANKISVSKTKYTKVANKNAQSFTINASDKSGSLTFTSNNSKIKVDKKGKVTVAANYIGGATITIIGKSSNYEQAKATVTINVNPAANKLVKVEGQKDGKMKVVWSKNTTGTGYKVEVANDKNFRSSQTITVKKAASAGTIISKLTKGKTYWVRVRVYKTVNKKDYNSEWSKAKSVKIPK